MSLRCLAIWLRAEPVEQSTGQDSKSFQRASESRNHDRLRGPLYPYDRDLDCARNDSAAAVRISDALHSLSITS